MLKALSKKISHMLPWKLLYADDNVIITATLKELVRKRKVWKGKLEENGMSINMGEANLV